jgi:type IV fimbrial biogenesis protein FimT
MYSVSHSYYHTSSQQGFSLLELLTVVLITSILITFSVSVGTNFISKNRTESTINTLMSGLYSSRMQAIQRGEKVIFCNSDNQQTCSGNWSDGQISISEQGEVLRVFTALPKQDKLIWSSSLGKNDALEWLPTGYTNGQRGTLYYCAGSGADASRAIVVLNSGRLYTADVSLTNYGKYCL